MAGIGTYSFRTCGYTNGVGERGGESSTQGGGYSVTHTYNSASPALGLLGQPASTVMTISGQAFSYSYSYDANNRSGSYASPSGLSVSLAERGQAASAAKRAILLASNNLAFQ